MECYPSRAKGSGLLVLVVLMVSASVFLATRDGTFDRIVGGVGALFFGLCGLALVRQTVGFEPVVTMDAEGITDRRLRAGPIPWSAIEDVTIGQVQSARILCLHVEDAEPFLARMPAWRRALARANRALGFPPLTISFSGLTPGLDEAYDHIRGRLTPRG